MLNRNYYNKLTKEYSISQDCNKTSHLSASIILRKYKGKKVYFNFPKDYDLREITNLLYERLSNEIFDKYADITDYSIGDKLKRNGEKWKNTYIIEKKRWSNLHVEKRE
jgi:hypothetical protein